MISPAVARSRRNQPCFAVTRMRVVRDVARLEAHGAAGRELVQCILTGLAIVLDDRDAHALVQEARCDRAADAAARARHERHLAIQSGHVQGAASTD